MFPMSIPSPPLEWQVFNLGAWLRSIGASWATFDVSVHTYALCILAGILAALWLSNRRLVARGAESWIVIDIALFAVPLGIIGGRAYHVLTHTGDYFYEGADLMRVFFIWEGGMAIFGAMIGGLLGAYIGCRTVGINLLSYLDALAPGMLIAQALGRVGNYFNHELYGWPTDLPWGLEIESTNPAYPIGLPEGILFHPTFLYEMIWNLLGAVVVIWLGRRYVLQWGRQFGLYLAWYGTGRIVWETIRLDPSDMFLGIRTNVWAAIASVVIGLGIVYIQGRRHTGRETSVYSDGRANSTESALESQDTYSVDELAKAAKS
ncbi:prolipoprotein diacylglyceryl transferase [Microbacteriaceae bacterium MWH-Ta3]|nr:prolipoprotein diacylglyceryl transferase [Microbacteriaceae bacterium MWH-Ta3]